MGANYRSDRHKSPVRLLARAQNEAQQRSRQNSAEPSGLSRRSSNHTLESRLLEKHKSSHRSRSGSGTLRSEKSLREERRSFRSNSRGSRRQGDDKHRGRAARNDAGGKARSHNHSDGLGRRSNGLGRRCEHVDDDDDDDAWQTWRNDQKAGVSHARRRCDKAERSGERRSISSEKEIIRKSGDVSKNTGIANAKLARSPSKSVESGKTVSVSLERSAVQAEMEENRGPSVHSRSMKSRSEKRSPGGRSRSTRSQKQSLPETTDPQVDAKQSEDVGELPASERDAAKDEPKAPTTHEHRRCWSSLLQTALKDAKSIQDDITVLGASRANNTPAQSRLADFDSVVDRVRTERRLRQRGVQTYGDGFDTTSIIVSGCANSTIRSVLKGTYSFSSMNHGRPVFQKDHAPKGLDVLIYYWDERDGDQLCGWWISPALGCDQAWAHHPSQSALAPPGTAWSVPHDEAVDPSFNLVSRETQTKANHDVQQSEELEKQRQGATDDASHRG